MRSTIYSSWAIALSIVSNTVAQTVSPSNSSQDLYPPATSPRFLLNGSEFPDMPAIRLAPLGHYAEMSYSDFTATDVNGQLISITSENVNDDFGGSPRKFFYVSCEPSDYPGNLHANEVFNLAANNENAFLIILYTTRSDYCTATGLDNLRALASVMTTTEPMVAEMLADMNLGPSSPGTATLLPDLNAYTNDTNSGTRSWYGPGRGSNGSPTTAVAMIILYSITGVITALFVTIIITGAIRAHRHPERYGPRVAGIGGRGRQGRARGIARAVVDSLPIVKFGDRDGDSGGATGGAQKKASVSNSTNDTTEPNETTRDSDIEMTAGLPAISSRNDSPSQPADTTTKSAAAVNTLNATTPTDTTTNLDSPSNPPTGPMPIAGASEEDAPSCSICTEDFVLGSDLRVLPCKHRFHPECVDPWLLNVSGTCPLCRIDLRPKDTGGNDLDPAGDGNGAAGLEGDAPADRAAGARQGSFSQAGGFRPGEDQIMAFSLRSGRSRGVSNANANRRPSTADRGAESAGALATLRRAMAGSREERVAALRRFREHEQRRAERDGVGEQGGVAGTGEGSEDVEARRRGLASRLRERLRVRTERRGEGQGEGRGQEQDQEQTLGQIRSREHVGGTPV